MEKTAYKSALEKVINMNVGSFDPFYLGNHNNYIFN
jgi:hypothetical protein